jgi:hypothetical protein
MVKVYERQFNIVNVFNKLKFGRELLHHFRNILSHVAILRS